MTKVHAVRVHRLGGPEVLRYEEVDVGSPGPGEARVRHTAIGLNFTDIHFRTGRYPLKELPHVIGMEAAGVVEEVGPGVTEVGVGDRVAYASEKPRAYAQATDRQTGLTIFRPTDGLDEGPIILQKTVEIGPDDTLGTVYFDRLFPMGVAALLEAADLVASGQSRERPQDETQATYEGWCRDPEAQINWYAHLDAIYNLIRGCNPSPGAWTTIGGCRVRLFDARKHVARRFGDVAGKVGEICAVGDQSLQIAVQGGRLEVFKVRADGGEKMTAAAFAAAAGLKLGSNVSIAIDPLYL